MKNSTRRAGSGEGSEPRGGDTGKRDMVSASDSAKFISVSREALRVEQHYQILGSSQAIASADLMNLATSSSR